MRHFLAFILMKLQDQRGEVGDDDDSGSDDDQDNDVIDDDVVVIDPDDLEDDEDPDDQGDDDINGDDDLKTELEDQKKKLEKYKTDLAERDKKIKEHNRNLYGMRKKFEALEAKGADKDAKFTDDQLEQMIDEHQGDSKMLVQVFKHLASQTADNKAKLHVDAAAISQRKKELDEHLASSWPGVYDEGSKDHQDIQKAKEYLHLEDHPLGDFLAGASTMYLQMPDMIDNAKKEAREGALKVEDNRKKTIKESSLETGKKKETPGKPSSNELAIAKQLDLSKSATKVYLQLRKQAKTATVEV